MAYYSILYYIYHGSSLCPFSSFNITEFVQKFPISVYRPLSTHCYCLDPPSIPRLLSYSQLFLELWFSRYSNLYRFYQTITAASKIMNSKGRSTVAYPYYFKIIVFQPLFGRITPYWTWVPYENVELFSIARSPISSTLVDFLVNFTILINFIVQPIFIRTSNRC
jgi:hypothetical protein